MTGSGGYPMEIPLDDGALEEQEHHEHGWPGLVSLETTGCSEARFPDTTMIDAAAAIAWTDDLIGNEPTSRVRRRRGMRSSVILPA
jgi:hypothetical protein